MIDRALLFCIAACGLTFVVRSTAADDAVTPGNSETHPTWACMGVNWHIRGDDNRNASVAVSFRRKGTDKWREAMPLWRHEFQKTRMFSGSVFRLAPGTAYEFNLMLKDPDGGGAERIVGARTFDYPRMPERVIDVPEGGLAEAQELAEAGTVLRIHKGKYPGAMLNKSGKPGKWIVYRSAGDGEVVIEGKTDISGRYIWLHGLTLKGEGHAVVGRGKSEGIVITSCRLSAHYAVHTPAGAARYFIADNVLTGDSKGKFTFGGEGVDFGSDKGRCGHAVCFNEFTEFADGVSYGRGNIDVYNNYIHETVDDFIEPDYSRENYRLWNNRCYNSMCGFSFQPMKGGPWYMFNNVNVGTYLHAFKVKKITGPSVIYGNTILTKMSRVGKMGNFLRGTFLNNVWLRAQGGAVGEAGAFAPGFSPTRVDHNAYGHEGNETFRRIGYEKIRKARGWDKNSLRVDYRKLFQEEVTLPAGKPYYSSKLQGQIIPRDWHFKHYLLIPRTDSKLIDAGAVLANLTGPYLGKAPDLGAHEVGLGTAWYGPRLWDDRARLVYGLPAGWKRVPPTAVKVWPQKKRDPELRMRLESPGGEIKVTLRVEPATGEARWKRARQIVQAEDRALTPVLEFQDGLYIRLYQTALIAGRVEPDGVLHVEARGSADAIQEQRIVLFQFARSLLR